MSKKVREGKGCEWSNIWDGVNMRRKRAEYFVQVQYVENVRETNINV